MKFNRISLPHPVLGIEDDVAGEYMPKLKTLLGRKTIKLLISQNVDNETIKGLILEGKASYCVEVHCIYTFYRKATVTTRQVCEIEIPSDFLRDTVEVSFNVIANEVIKDYQIKGASIDYGNSTFYIEKGDVLATGGTAKFMADKDPQAFKSITSFMEIHKVDEPQGPIEIVLTSKKVVIRMCVTDYNKFYPQSKNRDLNPIFHSSIAFPALIRALYEINREDTEHEQSAWYQWLKLKLETDFTNFDIDDDTQIPYIAQAILKNPISRTISGINNIFEQPSNGE